jgi:hypothetical protein
MPTGGRGGFAGAAVDIRLKESWRIASSLRVELMLAAWR